MPILPFSFSYKSYPRSGKATFVNMICSVFQKLFFYFSILLLFFIVIGDVENVGAALIGVVVMSVLWLLLKLLKDKWSDAIAVRDIPKE